MHILFDARPLQERLKSGVHLYAEHLAEGLLAHPEASVTFFRNAHVPLSALPRSWYRYPYTEKTTHIPNKLLSIIWSMQFGHPIEYFGKTKGALVFAPNINFFKLGAMTPFALTIHDLSFAIEPRWFGPKQRLWHRLTRPRTLARRAQAIIAVSEHTKQDLIDLWGIAPEKIHVIYPGIPQEHPEELLPNLPEQFILTVSTIEPRKNIAGLISAFEILAERSAYTDLHLVICGPVRWGGEKILQIIAKSPRRRRIHHYGYVSEGQKTFALRRARAFVYPSFYEGFGFPPLEALRADTPVVASFGGALSETIGPAALLVNPFLPGEIADATEAILSSTTLRTNLSQRRDETLGRCSWQASAAAHLKLFQSLTL